MTTRSFKTVSLDRGYDPWGVFAAPKSRLSRAQGVGYQRIRLLYSPELIDANDQDAESGVRVSLLSDTRVAPYLRRFPAESYSDPPDFMSDLG